jgi:acyl-CoA thioesterase-1
MDSWLAGQEWAVIHFNWGLWDLKFSKEGKNNIPIEQYGKNLRELVAKMKKTGTIPIFATTTPVPERVMITPRRTQDAILYNAVARRIMEEMDVHVDDLYEAVLPRIHDLQHPSDVHFNDDGSRYLAQRVTASVDFMLYLRKNYYYKDGRTPKP